MLTPPLGLSNRALKELIEQAWDVAVDFLEYRPVGFGSHHWMAMDNLGLRHFVTVDELTSDSRLGDEVSVLGMHLRSALAAASDLRAFGCSFVVAPIATKVNDLFARIDDYAVTLFPFIDGRSFSFAESFSEADRDRVLELVIALHTVPIASIRPPPVDGFVVPWLDQIERSMRYAAKSSGPYAVVASRLLVDNETEITRLIVRYRTLVARYLRGLGPVVITHGEIHPGNVLVTSKGLVIVDWDTVLVAPPERDLWRLAREDGSVLHTYAETTGTAPDECLVDLYDIRWDLAEIASFAREFREPHEDSEDSRQALEILESVVRRLTT